MKIISFLSPKGSGKTTAVINVASCLASRFKVAVIDTDPQQSILNWNTSGKAKFDVYSLSSVEDILNLRHEAVLSGVDFVIVDGFGSMHPMMKACVTESDLVVIPVTPSPIDFSVSTQMIDLIDAIGSKVVYQYLITKKINRTKMLSIVLGNFDRMGAPVLKSMLSQRQSFINST